MTTTIIIDLTEVIFLLYSYLLLLVVGEGVEGVVFVSAADYLFFFFFFFFVVFRGGGASCSSSSFCFFSNMTRIPMDKQDSFPK